MPQEVVSNMKKREPLIALIFIFFCIVLYLVPTGFENASVSKSMHVKGVVLECFDNFQSFGIVKVGSQSLKVRLEQGPLAGRVIDVMNQLSGKLEIDEYYLPGDSLLVEYLDSPETITGFARGHYRLRLELVLIVFFASVLCLIAGWTGFRALISFVFAALLIWKVMIPLLLKNIDPFAVSVCIVLALTASVSFLVGGLNRRGIVTFLGACSGLMLACVLAFIFASAFKINGAVRPFAESLLYSGYAELNLTRIFICGIFIACSGAVMDLAMDISSAMDEIQCKKPEIAY